MTYNKILYIVAWYGPPSPCFLDLLLRAGEKCGLDERLKKWAGCTMLSHMSKWPCWGNMITDLSMDVR